MLDLLRVRIRWWLPLELHLTWVVTERLYNLLWKGIIVLSLLQKYSSDNSMQKVFLKSSLFVVLITYHDITLNPYIHWWKRFASENYNCCCLESCIVLYFCMNSHNFTLPTRMVCIKRKRLLPYITVVKILKRPLQDFYSTALYWFGRLLLNWVRRKKICVSMSINNAVLIFYKNCCGKYFVVNCEKIVFR